MLAVQEFGNAVVTVLFRAGIEHLCWLAYLPEEEIRFINDNQFGVLQELPEIAKVADDYTSRFENTLRFCLCREVLTRLTGEFDKLAFVGEYAAFFGIAILGAILAGFVKFRGAFRFPVAGCGCGRGGIVARVFGTTIKDEVVAIGCRLLLQKFAGFDYYGWG